MAKINPNIEILDFKKLEIGPESGEITITYYNNKIKAEVEICAEAYEVSKWVAENEFNESESHEMINGSHEYTSHSLDPWVWIREEMEAKDFVQYLTDKGVI